jgi:hypothetical protein
MGWLNTGLFTPAPTAMPLSKLASGRIAFSDNSLLRRLS